MDKGKKIALLSLVGFSIFAVVVLYHSISPYITPSQVVEMKEGKNLQVVGRMEDLVVKDDYSEFYLTDGKNRIKVVYEGKTGFIEDEVVVIGDWDGILHAQKILRKCHTEYSGGR
jgi:cytochrome c-type biogenesis protein CcmE